jgi:serine protease Do
MIRRSWTSVVVCVAVMALATASASAQRYMRVSRDDDKTAGFRDNPRMLAAFRDVVATPGKSVVRIDCDNKAVALGTVVGADGWILTKNSQLTTGATPSVVLRDGRTLVAKVVGVEYRYDLAMLKIEAKDLTPVKWGQSKTAAVGNLLAAPGTSATPVGVGVVSVAARAVRPRDLPPSEPPANAGFLGVALEEAGGGARIINIVPESAAARAGLAQNDIVTLIADTHIIDSETMVNTIQQHKPGDVVIIRLRRGEQEMDLQATLGKRPPPDPEVARRDSQQQMGSELSNRRGGFPQVLQTDMILKPTECGGPVVDLDGKAVGIAIARAGRTESYALPSEAVQTLIEDLKSGKLPVKREGGTTKPTTAPSK